MSRHDDRDSIGDVDAELQIVRRYPMNILVVGSVAATTGALHMLRPGFREPVVTWQVGQALELPPPSRPATVLLLGVDQLTRAAQVALLQWMEQSAGHARVVSTATEPLWPSVERGAFDEALYYWLNVIYLRLAAMPDGT
jgi:hypothetical protein